MREVQQGPQRGRRVRAGAPDQRFGIGDTRRHRHHDDPRIPGDTPGASCRESNADTGGDEFQLQCDVVGGIGGPKRDLGVLEGRTQTGIQAILDAAEEFTAASTKHLLASR
ncbi:hypothetical protein GCM10010251_31820 [Streptomyces aurantiogriseus]|uniref:Uncharacterized protein n=1 Tax=Streptomyces aurantiogriseus TaxID=66870 RepID=A0A918C9W0_9ACTN|nr:hypothetical protein GCM10010251_31820 [Streptomyces aurantiogriseus]